MGTFKTFFRQSGALAYETANFDGFVAAHGSISENLGVVAVNGDDRINADFIVFEVEDTAGEFDIYNLRNLPDGVEYVGHYSSLPDVLDDLDALEGGRQCSTQAADTPPT
jgi:hypothetical protein